MYNDKAILGSHNSWSYLRPKKWWMRLIGFTAKCQKHDIYTQYLDDGVRCFDLRLRFDNHLDFIKVVHGPIEYDTPWLGACLDWLNNKDDVFIRVILDVRSKRSYTTKQKALFAEKCAWLQLMFPNIKFFGGQNLYNYQVEYDFGNNVSMEENYSSVKAPKWIDDWFPWFYAKRHNEEIVKKGTDKDVLLIDFVDIQ